MHIKSLRIKQFRNLADASLAPSAGLNVVTGPNACGKTALLEAIYLLGRGRSFRTHRVRELIQHHQSALQVTARLQTAHDLIVPVGVERDQRQLTLRYNAQPVRNLSEHARRLPLVLITPDSHDLVAGGPAQRRRWLDWALFHVEPEYLNCWQACFHALRQRNSLLKHRVPDAQLDSWEQVLAQQAGYLDTYRWRFIEQLEQRLREIIPGLLQGEAEIRYQPGRNDEREYREVLRQSRATDRERGFTQSGPHRGDLRLTQSGAGVRANLSRGQTKLYIAALMLAYAAVLTDNGLQPLILVDDLPAELDDQARQRFMSALAAANTQTFVTAIEYGQLPLDDWPTATLFHVEQECRQEVIQ